MSGTLWLSIGYLHACKKLLCIYFANTKAGPRLGCVLFLTALVPDCVKMSVGPAVARSAAPRTLQASAADESLTAATNHQPPSLMCPHHNVNRGWQSLSHQLSPDSVFMSQIVTCTHCYIRKRYPDSDVTPLAPDVLWPHRGVWAGERAMPPVFTRPVTQYQELLSRPDCP